MQVGVQRGNDRRRRQHGNPQTRACEPQQEEGEQARADDGSLYSWRCRFRPDAGRAYMIRMDKEVGWIDR